MRVSAVVAWAAQSSVTTRWNPVDLHSELHFRPIAGELSSSSLNCPTMQQDLSFGRAGKRRCGDPSVVRFGPRVGHLACGRHDRVRWRCQDGGQRSRESPGSEGEW